MVNDDPDPFGDFVNSSDFASSLDKEDGSEVQEPSQGYQLDTPVDQLIELLESDISADERKLLHIIKQYSIENPQLDMTQLEKQILEQLGNPDEYDRSYATGMFVGLTVTDWQREIYVFHSKGDFINRFFQFAMEEHVEYGDWSDMPLAIMGVLRGIRYEIENNDDLRERYEKI